MSDHTLIALSREVAALTVERDRLQQVVDQQHNAGLFVLNEKRQLQNRCDDLARENVELIDQLQALEAAASWQPSATAPKDGTPVLIHVFGGATYVCWWKDYWTFYQVHGGKTYTVVHPTHWMPLPAPPAASRREEES